MGVRPAKGHFEMVAASMAATLVGRGLHTGGGCARCQNDRPTTTPSARLPCSIEAALAGGLPAMVERQQQQQQLEQEERQRLEGAAGSKD